jgi:AraC family transcriptional regulator
MEVKIIDIKEKIMIGMVETMSGNNNFTWRLFSFFMPRRKEIENKQSSSVFDVRIYPNDYFKSGYNPERTFRKWAAMEVYALNKIPEGMQVVTIPAGKYAVFTVPKNIDSTMFQYIFTEWLPNSQFTIDSRPHYDEFDVKAIAKASKAMQRIMIPIRLK